MANKMYEAIRDFNLQFSYKPEIKNGSKLPKNPEKIIVAGMGGSHLAADLLKITYPEQVLIHSNYGIPPLLKSELKKCLFIASSYSGNTEEVLDGLKQAKKNKMVVAAIGTGGKLITLARRSKIPYIKFPEAVQPRTAIGYSFMAMLKMMKKDKELNYANRLAGLLKPLQLKGEGQKLAKNLKKLIPVIYSSEKNKGLALNWKVRFNETAKKPAFFNVFPEMNHNEMIAPGKDFCYLLLKDKKDDSKIKKRMKVMEKIYKKEKAKIITLELKGKDRWERIFNSIILADWTTYYLAIDANKDPENIPLIEKFKKMIK